MPIANVCAEPERPFKVEIPPVAEPTSIKTTLPKASTVSALPVKDEVALPEVSEENASPPTVLVALEILFTVASCPMNAYPMVEDAAESSVVEAEVIRAFVE